MFRKAVPGDLDQIAAIYDAIHTEEETGRATIGWIRAIYPTRQTAADAIQAGDAALFLGDMYVAEEEGRIVASAKIDQTQVPEYADAPWSRDEAPDAVLVLHTLVVDPSYKGRGCATRFVHFYEDLGRKRNCTALRMDTNERNAAARSLYAGLGYQEVGIVSCDFNGIPGIRLVCLEKLL